MRQPEVGRRPPFHEAFVGGTLSGTQKMVPALRPIEKQLNLAEKPFEPKFQVFYTAQLHICIALTSDKICHR